MKKLVHMVSLGCAKNLVDSEVMLGLLGQAGYQATSEPESADLLLVNTCGFIGSAVEEAIDEILALVEYKNQDPGKRLVVTGCLVQRYGRELQKDLPEVDLFIGTDGFKDIVSLLAGEEPEIQLIRNPVSTFVMDSSLPRTLSTPNHRAYLKVTEGCDNRCTYCIIPSIRGRLRSRSLDDLLVEARGLAALGVQELTLVAQDLLAYGSDNDMPGLQLLLERLLAETPIPWIRLLYLHPARLTPDFLRFMAGHPRILPYLDIPLQHVSDPVLKRMNRPYGRAHLEHLVASIREILPHAAIRTTLMVGFPGESEVDVDAMADFLERHRFDHVGVFAYANEEGCAAQGFVGQLPEEEKLIRKSRIMELQAGISRELLAGKVGGVVQVLVEGVSRETDLLLEGRTMFQAPDIDGCVYITAGETRAGAIVDVRITEAHDYDLVGELVTAV